MYYLDRKFEDEFLYVAIKLDYPILSQKMDHISAITMRQESNITKKFQQIILQHLIIFLLSD